MYAMYFSKDEIGGRYPSLCNIFNNVYLHMYSISIKLIAFYVYMFIKKIKNLSNVLYYSYKIR